jgi:hypothetical protein
LGKGTAATRVLGAFAMLSRLVCAGLAVWFLLLFAVWFGLFQPEAWHGVGVGVAALAGFGLCRPGPLSFKTIGGAFLGFGASLLHAPRTAWRLAFGKVHAGLVLVRWPAIGAELAESTLAKASGVLVVRSDPFGALTHVLDETDPALFDRIAGLAPRGVVHPGGGAKR